MNQAKHDNIKSFFRLMFVYVLIFYFTSSYVVSVYKIEGNSMYPLLDNGDRVAVNRMSYKISEIQRNDVVVFYAPNEPRKYYIKRVIGLPGESLRISHGNIYIDGVKREEPFIKDQVRSFETIRSMTVPLGHYFVAGDNRSSSNDSRIWSIQAHTWPFVGERYILGKVRCRIWPLTRICWFESYRDLRATEPAGL